MNVKVLHIVGVGAVLAEVLAHASGIVRIKNPVSIVATPQGFQAIPLLILQEKDTVDITEDKLLFTPLSDPIIEMRNQYNQMFGVGIVEAREMPKIQL
jgi:hypothetical protein